MAKNRFGRVLLISVVILFAGLLYGLFVQTTGFAVPCVFYKITGLKCPGCGVTHMCVALLRLDFKEAFKSHPMLFVQLPILCLIFLKSIMNYVKEGTCRVNRYETVMLYICIFLLVVFAAFRNIQIIL